MLRVIALSLVPVVALAQDAVFVGTVAAPGAGDTLVGRVADGVFALDVDGRHLSLPTTSVVDRDAMRTWTASGDGVVLTLTATARRGREAALDLRVLSEAWLTLDVAQDDGSVHRTTARLEQLVPRERRTSDAFDDFDDPIEVEPFEFETAPAAR